MAKPALDAWLRDQAFLPAVLRDFHKQKTLFKRIGQAIEKRRNSLDATSVDHELPTWIVGHIYVIDYFLWFMAKHGYTLQKTHARYEFYDLDETLDAYEQERLRASGDILRQAFVQATTVASTPEQAANSSALNAFLDETTPLAPPAPFNQEPDDGTEDPEDH